MLNRTFSFCCALGLAALNTSAVYAAEHDMHAVGHDHSRVDAHAPIGVMGDHMMGTKEWMFSYRLMNMHMDGMRSGTDNVSPEEIAVMSNALAGEPMRMGNLPNGDPRIMNVPPTYRISPLEMDMKMQMFSFMYGVSADVTAMVMFSYIEKEMTSRTFAGMNGTIDNGTYTGKTSGIGDTKVSALMRLNDQGIYKAHWSIGLSLPTGSITEDGNVLPPFAGMMIPAGETVDIDRLAYNMQLGSGTVDILPGITFTAREDDLSWGGQLSATIRFYDNKEDYRLGNVLEGTAWVARQWQPWVSTSLRVSAKHEGGIKGRDSVITGGNPVADAANTGRDEVNLHLAVNLMGQNGWVKGQRLALELGTPIYEKADGVQMSHDLTTTLAWQATF